MSQTIGVSLEETNALKDAQDYLNERGSDVTLYMNDEDSVTRDIYGSIKKRTPTELTLHAHPITYNPTDDQLMEAGIKEAVDCIITLATKDFTDNGLTYEDIDHVRWEIKMDGVDDEVYLIKDENQINRFSYSFLNIVLGLTKK